MFSLVTLGANPKWENPTGYGTIQYDTIQYNATQYNVFLSLKKEKIFNRETIF